MTPDLDELLAHLPDDVRAGLIASVAELKAQGWSDERIAEIIPVLPPDEAGRELIPYCQWIDPNYSDPPHIHILADALRQVQRYVETRGREGIGRLIINLPPRTGKSLTVSKRFPAFLLGQHPDWRIALIGYNDEFAADFSRAVRAQCSQYERTEESERYHLVFPDINVNPASSAVGRWSLSNRSADDPTIVAAGINGSLVGRGFNAIIIDDPVKPLASDTPIPTPGGWKLMGELNVGDSVFDHAGVPCRVIAKTPHYKAPRYRVWFSDNSYIDAHPDHLWMAFDRLSHAVYNNGSYNPKKKTGKRRTEYESSWWNWSPKKSGAKSGVSKITTRQISDSLVARKTMRNWTVPNALPLSLPDADLLVDPYILGYWLGDGSKRDPEITIHADDIPNLLDHISAAGYHVLSRSDCHYPTCVIRISTSPKKGSKWGGDTLRARLKALGVLGNKKIPPAYLRASYDQRLALLRGLMDSDGTVEPKFGEVTFCSTDAGLADGVYELIVSLGGKVVEKTRPAANKTAHILRGFFPFQPFDLHRKAARYRPNGQIRRVNRTITRVEVLGETDHLCITVDSESHLFLAGRAMVPTCNSRIEAESPAYREQLKSQYKGTIRTRLEPGGAIIVCATRWHEDDLPGWLIAQEKIGGEHYHVINIPALVEDEEDRASDPLGRDIGESIWPERLPVHELQALKMAVMDYEWASQYKGRPKPAQGGLIPRSYFAGKILPMLPDKFRSINGAPPAERLRWVRYWDLAVSTEQAADYFASARLAFDNDENLYIMDMVRDKQEWPDQRQTIKAVMLSELELGTHHYIEEALHGKAAVQDFLRDPELRRVPVEGVRVDKDKRIRAMPFITRAKAGKVYLIAGSWVPEFLNEASNFTGSGKDAHDDQIDTCSGGVAAAKPTAQTDLLEYMRRRMARRKELEDAKKQKAGDQTPAPAPSDEN